MQEPIDTRRLKTLLDRPETLRLVDALKRRLEHGVQGDLLTLPDPSDGERRAIEQILGRPPGRGRSLRIPISELERVLRSAGIAPDLRGALVALRGPLRNILLERSELETVWNTLFEDFAREPGQTRAWLDDLAASGLLKRLSDGDPGRAHSLLQDAASVFNRLPAEGLSLSRLAAETLGDAHKLDPGKPVGTLVRRALVLALGREPTCFAEGERELWAGAGVLIGGGITSLVLGLNLPASGTSPTDSVLQGLARVGEPIYLTLRQLIRDPPVWDCPGRDISICENPAVVAEAASRLGSGCKPLICTQGQPSAAAGTLFRQLVAAGGHLRYHGDFDWPGIRIANGLIRRHGASPWRMRGADYLEAPGTGKPLAGKAADASWDPGLMTIMQQRGEILEEECVIERLLDDLGGGGI